jgi:hypothetical protein
MFNLIDKSAGYLFSSRDIRELMETRVIAMRQEIEQLDANRLLNTSSADLSCYLIEKYTLQAPSLRRDDWSASEQETQVDVRHDQNRWIDDSSRPCLVPGQRIEVEVPIAEIFRVVVASTVKS